MSEFVDFLTLKYGSLVAWRHPIFDSSCPEAIDVGKNKYIVSYSITILKKTEYG